MAGLVFSTVETRHAQRSLRSPELRAGRPGFREAFAGALRDQVALDVGELTGDERDRFIAAVRADPRPAVQTFALTLVHTGARISEALALRPVDIDLEATEIRFRTLKRRREHWRAVPVPEAVVRELELVHGLRRTKRSPRERNGLLWPFSRPTATRHIARLMAAAGIEGPQACPKGLRHAYGVAAVAAGVPLPTVAAVLGHANLTTTAIYTTAIGAEARELVARMWGEPSGALESL